MNAGSAHSVEYVFPPPAQASLPIDGMALRFPVHRIYCVGRNYAEHALEMGGDPTREPPFFFQKNPDSLVLSGRMFPYPPATKDVHHEMEMVVAIGRGGRDIPIAEALDHVYGYAAGLDMTRRDLQAEAKKLGRPWETAKAFENSAPCSHIVPASVIGHPASGAIWLDVNGVRRQTGDLEQLIWSVPEIIAALSGLFVLAPGDLIYTGTPAGVGQIVSGDHLVGGVEGIATIDILVE